jgi:hypothetical protein
VPRFKNKGSPESEVDLPIYSTVEGQDQELRDDLNGVDSEGDRSGSSSSLLVMNLARQ